MTELKPDEYARELERYRFADGPTSASDMARRQWRAAVRAQHPALYDAAQKIAFAMGRDEDEVIRQALEVQEKASAAGLNPLTALKLYLQRALNEKRAREARAQATIRRWPPRFALHWAFLPDLQHLAHGGGPR